MSHILHQFSIVLFLIVSCLNPNQFFGQDKIKIEEEIISEYKFKYGKPIGSMWELKKFDDPDQIILNYIKRSGVKKELSILIFESPKMDVQNSEIQRKAKSRFAQFNEFYEEELTEEFGSSAFIFKGKTAVNQDSDIYVYCIHSYANGYEYNITLSCYERPVDEDEELKKILSFIQIQK